MLFFDLLKRKMLYSRIVRSYSLQRNMNLLKHSFAKLAAWRDSRISHLTQVEIQVSTLLDQSNTQIMQSAFESLKSACEGRRVSRLAERRHEQILQKKAFLGLAIATQKAKIFHFATAEVRVRRKARFVGLWLEAIGRKRTAEISSHVIKVNKLRRILLSWRCLIEKQRLAFAFHQTTLLKRLLPLAFSALSLCSQRSLYLRHCEREIAENHRFALLKQVMLSWLEQHNLRKIDLNMRRFHAFKTMKVTFSGWRAVKEGNSAKRRDRLQIRRALKKRPELAKPLFVIRNVMLYKAFKMMQRGVSQSVRMKKHKVTASFAFYVRMLRKGWDAMMINRDKRLQRKKLTLL